MHYTTLGRTGLRVSELCLGTMTFGNDWGWGASPDESRRIFDVFAEAGGNFIDTANIYTNGSSETLVGEFVRADRDRFIIGTKYTHARRWDHPNAGGTHRRNLVASVEESLARLRTDYIDVLWVHAWDFLTPPEEVMRGLDHLVRSGKVMHVAASDTPAWMVAHCNALADARGWTPFAAVQTEYNLVQRDAERDILPMAAALGLSAVAWAPLGSGLLTGRYGDAKAQGRLTDVEMYQGSLGGDRIAAATALTDIARAESMTPAQAALRWLMQRAARIIPVVGARTAAQMKENMAAADVSLSDAARARLDTLAPPALGFPHDFLKSPVVQNLMYAGMRDRISA